VTERQEESLKTRQKTKGKRQKGKRLIGWRQKKMIDNEPYAISHIPDLRQKTKVTRQRIINE